MPQEKLILESALLTVRWQRGEAAAFEEIVKLWEKPLYYYLRRLMPTEADAWELLQEMWLQAFKSLRKLRDPHALPAFLYTTARNLAMTRLRGRGMLVQAADPDNGHVPVDEGEVLAFDNAESVHHALDKLPVLQREALTLYFLQDLTIEEMAEVLGVAVGTVKSRLHYGRQAMRKILTPPKEMTMSEASGTFREKLFAAQEMTPTLREEYRRELETLMYEKPTLQSRTLAITMLVICVAVVIGEIRAMIVYPGGASFYVGATTMLVTCAAVAWLILRDLVRGKSPRKNVFKVSEMFYGASWMLVMVELFKGLGAPADPASTFNVLFVLTFAAVCTTWGLANRIKISELQAQEQSLRVEYRLAELAQRLGKSGSADGSK